MTYESTLTQSAFDAALALGRKRASEVVEAEMDRVHCFARDRARDWTKRNASPFWFLKPWVIWRRLSVMAEAADEATAAVRQEVDFGDTFRFVYGKRCDLLAEAAKAGKTAKSMSASREASQAHHDHFHKPRWFDPVTKRGVTESEAVHLALFDKHQRARLQRF